MEENFVPRRQLGVLIKRIAWLLGAAALFYGGALGAAYLSRAFHFRPLTAALLGEAPILLIALLFAWLDGGGLRNLRFAAPWQGLDVAAIPLILVVHFAGSFVVGLQMQAHGGSSLQGRAITGLFNSFSGYSPGEFLLLSLLLALMAGIGEELLFRGYLITRLERIGLPGWACITISALVFGLLHWSGYGFIPAIAKAITFGLPAGLYFWHRRNLGPLMVAHTLMDYLGFVLVFFVVKLLGSVPGL